ncbi:RB1-inducible coiled-coil protein 1 isoform X2 [Cloeon dipterum]|uniref:RB1-inducible coiled-coil protein 1 isoform X2 n=1 Tax=Cloeon dipterum TaxID=197152 RepID=UPI00321F7E69
MLYVFHVETGSMMTYDMNLALESVAHLKGVIGRMCSIPPDKQVLLVSGGESLDSNNRVCQYSAAGTDTNPIFLFSKCTIESTTPLTPSVNYGSDVDMNEETKYAIAMQPSYDTVLQRTKLAKKFFELAKEQTKVCEQLVHDQHLQQQGWAAVVANLEDTTKAFEIKAELFEQHFNQFLQNREEHYNLLQNFRGDLEILSQIPVLPALLLNNENIDSSQAEATTLLEWITSTDRQSNMDQAVDSCFSRLEQLNETTMQALKKNIETAIETASNTSMKEIKGLEERLSGLENIMVSNKRYVQEQEEHSIGLNQNLQRLNKLGDETILPDLCQTHSRHLSVMLKNHQQMRDILKRCTKAKEELSLNLLHRLKWVVFVQNNISDVSHKLLIYHEGLKALKNRLDIFQQVHLSPDIYLNAVGEVVRRRAFSKAFLKWAHDLSAQSDDIYKEEISRRKAFHDQFENHFLRNLFPGLNDEPPPFAAQPPNVFDNYLPELTCEDIKLLKQQLPEMASAIPEYTESSFNFMFSPNLLRSTATEQNGLTPSQDAADSSIGALLQPTSSAGHDLSPQPSIDVPSLPKEDRGFESETDTEEFEKVGQSPVDPNLPLENPPCLIQTSDKSSSQQSSTPSVQPEKEENLGSVSSQESLTMSTMKKITNLAMTQAKQWRDELKTLSLCMAENSKDMGKSLEDCRREILERVILLQQRHEETIADLKKMLHEREQNLAMAKEELDRVETKEGVLMAELQAKQTQALEELSSKMRCEAELELARQVTELQAEAQTRLEQTLNNAEAERKAAIKEVTDRLNREHRLELEGLRSRFKMVHASQMERSPSDTSLEKIERGDLIELAAHEAALTALRQEMSREQELAVQEGEARERKRLQAELDRERAHQMRSEAAKQVSFNEALRRVAADKDRQLENLRQERDQLAHAVAGLKDELARAEREKRELQEMLRRTQLQQHRRTSRVNRHVSSDSMSASSVAVVPESSVHGRGDIGQTTSPETSRRRLQDDSRLRERLSRSTNAMIQEGLLRVGSCNTGDIVLVLWDEELNNYIILQDSSTLYFLHSDCIELLGLSTSSTDVAPRKMYSIAQVVKKEYCFARKAENRFGVPKDTRFYRVMVQSLQRGEFSAGSSHHQRGSSPRHGGASAMSSSQQFSRAELETSRFGPGNSSTL